jgi:hypothetical protein
METSKKSTLQNSLPLTSSVEVFPASPSLALEKGKGIKMKGGSGRSSTVPFAKLAPDGSWWKMFQGFCQRRMDGSLEAYSETWPAAGTMRNGICYRRPPLVPRTSDFACFLWPNPEAACALGGHLSRGGKRKGELLLGGMAKLWPTPKSSPSGPDFARMRRPDSGGDDLATAVVREIVPTPQHGDYRSGTGYSHEGKTQSPQLRHLSGGQLNPMWVEWLMGFPLGWTDLNVSETP